MNYRVDVKMIYRRSWTKCCAADRGGGDPNKPRSWLDTFNSKQGSARHGSDALHWALRHQTDCIKRQKDRMRRAEHHLLGEMHTNQQGGRQQNKWGAWGASPWQRFVYSAHHWIMACHRPVSDRPATGASTTKNQSGSTAAKINPPHPLFRQWPAHHCFSLSTHPTTPIGTRPLPGDIRGRG